MFRLLSIKMICLAVVIFSSLLFAQFPNIPVSDVGNHDPEEVTIAINPANPNHLAAGANMNHYYYSFNLDQNYPNPFNMSTRIAFRNL